MTKHDLYLEMDSRVPIDFSGRRIQAIVKCNRCSATWVISYDIPNKAIQVLQPDASKQRVEDFFKVFADQIESRAKEFIEYWHGDETEVSIACEGENET